MSSLSLLILSLLIAIGLCVHVVRTGRASYWLWIILMFQPLGGLVYFLTQIVPGLLGGPTVRRVGQAARETLDPHREYREAKAACEDTPTVRNQSRLAAAAMHLHRYAEAEAPYRPAPPGGHAASWKSRGGGGGWRGWAGSATMPGTAERPPRRSRSAGPMRTSAASRRRTRRCSGPRSACRASRASPATPPSWPATAAATRPARPSRKWTSASPS